MTRLALLAALVIAGSAAAAAQPDLTDLHIQKVRDNLYVVTGGRGTGASAATISGNTSVFVTDAGVVLIDTKLPTFGQGILDAVKTVTPKPVTTIINTHTHNDHTGSNNELPRGLQIIAHVNTKSNMEKMDLFKRANAALPTRTFSDRLTLFGGKDRIELYYFGAGHTNGDTVIVFPALRTAVMGDLFARKWAPLVDAANGGSATAFPDTLAKALAGIKDVDNVITGHSTRTVGRGATATFLASGPVMPWRDLQEYAQFTRTFVTAAQTAMKAGKSVDDALAGLKLPDAYQDYDMTNARADIQRVYEEAKQ